MSVTVFLMSPFLMPLTSCRHLRLTLVSACLFHATFFYNHRLLHLGLITLLIGLAAIVGSSLATAGPFPFTRLTSLKPSCVCVFTSPITLYQAVDRSCNRMSAFLESTALFSVPTRQIAKKVTLTLTVTAYKRAILHNKYIPNSLTTHYLSVSLTHISIYMFSYNGCEKLSPKKGIMSLILNVIHFCFFFNKAEMCLFSTLTCFKGCLG